MVEEMHGVNWAVIKREKSGDTVELNKTGTVFNPHLLTIIIDIPALLKGSTAGYDSTGSVRAQM
ncbi:hypothetical protein RhiJN_17153 [Ceratobasidium sp. AG-Ba]|nr:hypothetical protein RhiJN_17153 [Ceratobasidium sp. AG-Ba]